MLHVLVNQIQRGIDQQGHQRPSRKYTILFKKLKHLLDQHFVQNLPVSAYADKLHLTQHHLNLVCREVTGKTAGEVIRARSLLEAKRLLTFTEMTVTEVATYLHFFDPSYFARIFRAETGLSPAAFQKAMSEKYRVK